MSLAEILIVEDDFEMARVLRKGFEVDKHSVTVAGSGAEALRIARQKRFQAIVLDVMLPELDGYSVAAALRGSGDRTPILMLTARDSVEDIVRGFDCGVEDYLTKPFSFLELSARVRSLIRRGQPASDKIQVADLTLETASFEVTRAGQSVHLTRTEFRLLEMLMRNAGHVVRRRDLVDSIWSAPTVDDNNIDVAISSLRAKVDKGQPVRLIQTVRGFGYRIADPRKP
jgi:two-component system, OmpR family, copper resistance phosphate regulon response regulator CusR